MIIQFPKWFGKLCYILAIALVIGNIINMARADSLKLVIAHRGASGYLPEHTLAAKAMAYGMGAHYIEQDVVLTKDGVPIILHDIHLDTVSDVAHRFKDRKRDDGHYYAIDFTLAEIKTLSIHERTKRASRASAFPKRFPQGLSNFQIPTLAEEIELVQGLNVSTGRNVGIYPEIKNPKFHMENGQDISKVVVTILTKYNLKSKEDLVVIQCFDWNETQRIRNDLGYKGKLVQLLGENRWGISPETDYDHLKSAAGMREMAKTVDGIGPWINQIVVGVNSDGTPQISDLVTSAKTVGLQIHPYTARADSLPKWASSFDNMLDILFGQADVDGIFTDFTDLVVEYLNQ